MPATGHVPSKDEVDEEIRACVAEHGAALLAYLRGRALPSDLADEVMNDALVVVWRKRCRGEEITQLRRYLFQVARNAAVDRLQQRFRKAEVTGQAALLESQEDTRDLIANADLAEDVRRAVLALPDQRRNVITLRVLCDFSIAETAEILGIAKGTVGSTTSSALRQLRDATAREHRRAPLRDKIRQAQAELKIEDI
jgi:RNA polymerase sigma factor (sigma-70 family)